MAEVRFDSDKMNAAAPKAMSATEENFQRLTENVDNLYDLLDRLQNRIEPILVESIPGPTAKDSQGYASPTGVSQRLATLCSRTDDLIDRVKYLAARIDL